ncbi:MAG: hypothetical protein SW833_15735, partial [Cyanobacteriota bacterium]|nr:hypothetical protein [Cyanobacteriota bacterium]
MRSFQQTLQHNLSAAVISAGLDAEGSKVPRTSTYYRSSATSLVYRSAIALSLSARSGLSPLQVAQVLVASLPDEFDSDGLGVRVLSSGWIEFVPSDGAIAFWLQEILSSVEGTGGDGEMGRG